MEDAERLENTKASRVPGPAPEKPMQTTLLTGSALARIRWASKPEGELERGAVGPPAAPGCNYKRAEPRPGA